MGWNLVTKTSLNDEVAETNLNIEQLRNLINNFTPYYCLTGHVWWWE